MLALRIRPGLMAVALMGAACSATPSPVAESTPAAPVEPAPASPTATTPVEESTLAELCDAQHEASLGNVAAQLDGLGERDPRELSAAMDGVRAKLEGLTLGPDGMSMRDSAIGLMADLAAEIDDADMRALTASAAVQSLRELELYLCQAPEI